MQVIQTNSWKSQLGNILGSLLGNQYQAREENKTLEKIKARQQEIFKYTNPTTSDANEWRGKQADLAGAIEIGDISDETLQKLGVMVGGDTAKYQAIRDAGHSILAAQTDWSNADDDTGRHKAHQRALDARQVLSQYGYGKGFAETDRVSADSLKNMHKNLLADFSSDAYEQWRNDQLLKLTGIGLLGKGFSRFQPK